MEQYIINGHICEKVKLSQVKKSQKFYLRQWGKSKIWKKDCKVDDFCYLCYADGYRDLMSAPFKYIENKFVFRIVE